MKTPKHDYEKLGKDLGHLITEKQMAYGDSYGKSGEVLKQLFPNGIPKESYTDALAIVRIVDKLFRIATDPTWGDESPWKDIAGYALLRYADTEGSCKKEEKKPEYEVTYSYFGDGKSNPIDRAIDLEWTKVPGSDTPPYAYLAQPKTPKKSCKGGGCGSKKNYNDTSGEKK